MHDLRRTAATRMAMKTGNVLLVKALTGHKTMSMMERYINVGADDVVNVMHQPAPLAEELPAPVVTQAITAVLELPGEPASAMAASAAFTLEQVQSLVQADAAKHPGRPAACPVGTIGACARPVERGDVVAGGASHFCGGVAGYECSLWLWS